MLLVAFDTIVYTGDVRFSRAIAGDIIDDSTLLTTIMLNDNRGYRRILVDIGVKTHYDKTASECVPIM